MLEIKKNSLKWARPLTPYRLAEIDGITLHHIEHLDASIEEVHRWHLENGWAGFGYGWFVLKDGTVIEGRGFNFQAHCANNNSHLLGIAFQGDYQEHDKEMPDAQFNAGIELIKWIKLQVPTVKIIDGHSHWRPTACPGRYFPLKEMLTLKPRGEKMAYSEAKQKALAEIQYLHKAGRISDPDYWSNHIKTGTITYLEYLVIGYAKEVRQNESRNN